MVEHVSARIAAHEQDPANECTTCDLCRQGVLTKLSKGGFTANWNRREFVLIGGTLIYANSREALTVAPKLFVHLIPGCEVLSWADKATPHNNVFALRLPPTEAGEESELLLLAADSPREKFEWQVSAKRRPGCIGGQRKEGVDAKRKAPGGRTRPQMSAPRARGDSGTGCPLVALPVHLVA